MPTPSSFTVTLMDCVAFSPAATSVTTPNGSVTAGKVATPLETAVATVTYRLVATAARERISLNVPLSTT